MHEDAAAENTAGDKGSLSQTVFDTLLDKFLRNELVPGDILNRRELAQDLGVSVAPVLEALLQLEMEGFVESIPRKGTLVKPVREEDVFGQLILREAIECQAARFYRGAPVLNARKRLDPVARSIDMTEPDTMEHWRQEIEFHRSLVELADCPALTREFVRVMRLGVFYLMNRILSPGDRMERRSHLELLDSLSAEHPDEAERVIREHLRSGKQHLFSR
jgi:DNA-binding GntR family transcriptional regulator